MDQPTHAPLPWTLSVDACQTCRDYGKEGEYQIPEVERGYHAHFKNRADAEFVLRACNNYYAMLRSLKDLSSATYRQGIDVDIVETAEQVIAQAEGRTVNAK